MLIDGVTYFLHVSNGDISSTIIIITLIIIINPKTSQEKLTTGTYMRGGRVGRLESLPTSSSTSRGL